MTLLWQNLWIFRQSVIRLTKNHCRFSYLGAIFHCLLAASVALFRGRQTLIGSANCTPNNKLSPSPLPSSLDQLRWRWRRCHSFLEKVPIWDKYQGPVSQNWPPLIPLPAQGLEKRVVGLVNHKIWPNCWKQEVFDNLSSLIVSSRDGATCHLVSHFCTLWHT